MYLGSRLTLFVEWYATHFDFTFGFEIRMLEVFEYGLLIFFSRGFGCWLFIEKSRLFYLFLADSMRGILMTYFGKEFRVYTL